MAARSLTMHWRAWSERGVHLVLVPDLPPGKGHAIGEPKALKRPEVSAVGLWPPDPAKQHLACSAPGDNVLLMGTQSESNLQVIEVRCQGHFKVIGVISTDWCLPSQQNLGGG